MVVLLTRTLMAMALPPDQYLEVLDMVLVSLMGLMQVMGRMLDVLCPVSCILCPVSCVLCPVSCVLCPVSCVLCPALRALCL
jgi:hypothetical protein